MNTCTRDQKSVISFFYRVLLLDSRSDHPAHGGRGWSREDCQDPSRKRSQPGRRECGILLNLQIICYSFKRLSMVCSFTYYFHYPTSSYVAAKMWLFEHFFSVLFFFLIFRSIFSLSLPLLLTFYLSIFFFPSISLPLSLSLSWSL